MSRETNEDQRSMAVVVQPANRLIRAISPYLLQHAHNPVDWYEWGTEALGRARLEDKPVFLSIGYSACHWCHVMERECFEDERIAAMMNADFVCIKVDREERPDLDEIYMAATQAFTRSGGWPMSVWLTPDLLPFFAGTYFPPEGRYGRPGFPDVLRFLAQSWKENRSQVLHQAEALTQAVRVMMANEPTPGEVPRDALFNAAMVLAGTFDPVRGGMPSGGTTKFPPSMAMEVMLRGYHLSRTEGCRRPAPQLLELVELTLHKMAAGGIYDHLGGGFARYSTDANWLVPHFEKMLYDQAMIAGLYLQAWQLTKSPLYARVAAETLDYVMADLQGVAGGFYSARDADSEGVEGQFYVWSRAEVMEVLGREDGLLFCSYYDIREEGNWEGRNILNTPRRLEVVARLHGLSSEHMEMRLAVARRKLFHVRECRVKPLLDDKVLASWNGLMITSLARGARILREDKYRIAAERAARFVLDNLRSGGRLLHVSRGGHAHIPGYLDDYAFLIEALITLYETTFDRHWLYEAAELNDLVIRDFRDETGGGFFFTARDAEQVIVRTKTAADGAIPSGNSVQLMNLLRLAILLDRRDLYSDAEQLVAAFAHQFVESPFRSERFLSAVDFYLRQPWVVSVECLVGCAGGNELVEALWQTYVPNLIVAGGSGSGNVGGRDGGISLGLTGKLSAGERARAQVCRGGTCYPPIYDSLELIKMVGG